MKIIIIAALLAVSLGLSGCGFAYNINRDKLMSSATEADYGPQPPANHEELERNLILERLKDPDSAKFKPMGKVSKSAIPSGFASPTPILVWGTGMAVNAKNAYGGYTGFQYYAFAWRDGKIIATGGPVETMDSPVFWSYIK